jgi:hypothetical protein
LKALLFFLLIFTLSCAKQNKNSCGLEVGDIQTKIIPTSDFDLLHLHGNISYEIIQDSLNFIEIQCGENLIDFIEVIQEDSTIQISNANNCSVVRKYKDDIQVKIHLSRVKNIYYDGTKSIVSRDTLTSDYFTYAQKNGAGSTQLKLKSTSIQAMILSGAGDFILSGKTRYAFLSVAGEGYCNTLKLQIQDSLRVTNYSYGSMYVQTSNQPFEGDIYRSGNVYYTGFPSLLKLNERREGKFYALNKDI